MRQRDGPVITDRGVVVHILLHTVALRQALSCVLARRVHLQSDNSYMVLGEYVTVPCFKDLLLSER
jgi:hypothetical protein